MLHFRIYTDDHNKDVIISGIQKSIENIAKIWNETLEEQHDENDWRALRLEVSENGFDDVLDSLH